MFKHIQTDQPIDIYGVLPLRMDRIYTGYMSGCVLAIITQVMVETYVFLRDT